MRGSERLVGALALPLRPGWGPMARELEGLGSDFAMRLESADQRAQRTFQRIASVGRRPTARREAEHGVTSARVRIIASRVPRPRAAGPEAPRRVDLAANGLVRDASAALGRR